MEELLMPREVARLAKVHVRTVGRWAREGRLSAIRTPGGHRRYRRTEVEAIVGSRYMEGKQ